MFHLSISQHIYEYDHIHCNPLYNSISKINFYNHYTYYNMNCTTKNTNLNQYVELYVLPKTIFLCQKDGVLYYLIFLYTLNSIFSNRNQQSLNPTKCLILHHLDYICLSEYHHTIKHYQKN